MKKKKRLMKVCYSCKAQAKCIDFKKTSSNLSDNSLKQDKNDSLVIRNSPEDPRQRKFYFILKKQEKKFPSNNGEIFQCLHVFPSPKKSSGL